ncbi:MAG TPA: acyl carrier protein [Gemmatimonadaceae bacterium]|nr:acyl carrier protein [Gemmatimonadaceae bacterium]
MSDTGIRAAFFRALARIAPEVDAAAIRPDAPLREQIDIDSMDFLNFMIELHRELGVEVPETDYAHFATVDSAVAYLGAHATH